MRRRSSAAVAAGVWCHVTVTLTAGRSFAHLGMRSFYEDDDVVVTKPGYNEKISDKLKEQESSHGDLKYVNGMIVRSTPYLEKHLNSARLYIHDKLSLIGAELDTQVTAASNEISNVTRGIQSLVKDPVLPNSIYILTATLFGSILSSRRGVVLRFATPTALGAGAFRYYMPKSFEETKNTVLDYEKAVAPRAYDQQTELIKQAKEQSDILNKQLTDLNVQLERNIHDARVYLTDLLK